MSKHYPVVYIFPIFALLISILACGTDTTPAPTAEIITNPQTEITEATTPPDETPPDETPLETISVTETADKSSILSVNEIEDVRKSDITDLQWESYVDSIIAQPISYSGQVLEVRDDGSVQIDDGKGIFTISILRGIPRDIAIALSKGDQLEGEGTVRDIDTLLTLTVEITVNTINGVTIAAQPESPTTEDDSRDQSAVGASRTNPFPAGELVSAPDWDIQVREIVRGDEAWNSLKEANQFNDPPGEGMEYILIKLYVKSTKTDEETQSIAGSDFKLTGDHLVQYSSASVVKPNPALDADLYTGGETEGWIAFEVSVNEGNLILVIDKLFSFDDDLTRFLAIDDGAVLTVDKELDLVAPTAIGINKSNPALLGEIVVSEDWEITVLEVIRGDAAWTMVQDANQFNDPPIEGMEYIAAKLKVRYIGTAEKLVSLNNYDVKSTGSVGQLYDYASVVVPQPDLDAHLFPGAEVTGWVVLLATISETDLVAVFEPAWDFSGDNTRFLSLEP